MNITEAEVKKVLEALEMADMSVEGARKDDLIAAAIATLKEALARPKQEPVGAFSIDADAKLCFHPSYAGDLSMLCQILDEGCMGGPYRAVWAYTSPRPAKREPLTIKQRKKVYERLSLILTWSELMVCIDAIETAHGIGVKGKRDAE